MEFPRKKPDAPAGTTKAAGNAAEDRALAHLLGCGLKLLARNYRTPGRGGGEIDLVMRDPGGTVLFIEVRQRASGIFGGAAASVGATKQRRIVFAARHFLLRYPAPPPCRFDVAALQAARLQWLRGAFESG